MPTAYVLINYDIGTEEKFIDKLKNVPGVMEVNEVNGVYDIVVKIASNKLDSLETNYNTTYKKHLSERLKSNIISYKVQVKEATYIDLSSFFW